MSVGCSVALAAGHESRIYRMEPKPERSSLDIDVIAVPPPVDEMLERELTRVPR
jgi:hypothetical protein